MQYDIEPQDIDEAFFEVWRAGGIHLQQKFGLTNAKWLRAELPLLREHFSFILGNNLYFVQVYNIDDDSRRLQYLGRLKAVVEDAHVTDAKAIGCYLPMKRSSNGWEAVKQGWGLIDFETFKPIDPTELNIDGMVLMGDWEIHDLGVQFARNYLTEKGWKIEHWQSDRHVFPSLIASNEGQNFAFVVSNSVQPHSEKGHRPESVVSIRSRMRQLGLIPKFIGLAVADGSHDPFDPAFAHLKRRLYRGGKILCSSIEIEDL
ncbi:hypothetical protein N8473_00920 [Amylibacter sp.]|nr:hypothetical protein [Amylibacter sp.]